MFKIFIPANKIAFKLIDLMADSRVLPSQWKFDIPKMLVYQNMTVLSNLKNFADGVEFNLSQYNIDIPAEFIVADPSDKMYITNGEVVRDIWIQ